MAWTSPRTWNAGEFVTAALLNLHLRDNLNAIVGGDKALSRLVLDEAIITLTGTQHDYNPGAAVVIRCNNASPLVFSGFVPAFDKQIIILEAMNSTVQVLHQNTGSTATNRVIGQSVSGQIVGLGGYLMLRYDGTTDRWRIMAYEPGAAIAFTPTLTFGGSATGMTGTFTGKYEQRGAVALINVEIVLTAKGSSTGSAVMGALPFTTATPATACIDPVTGFASLTGTFLIGFGNASTTGTFLIQTTTARTSATEANFTNTSQLRFGVPLHIA